MTTYQIICDNNKYLYGLLEELSIRIKETGDKEQAALLKDKRALIYEHIERNLAWMDMHWHVKASVFVFTQAQTIEMISETERAIIKQFSEDPNLRFIDIAEKLHTTAHMVAKTIGNYLQHKYCEVA